MPTAPPNNSYGFADVFYGAKGYVIGSNILATTQGGESTHGGFGPFNSVWFFLDTGSNSGLCTVTLVRKWPDSFDPVICVHSSLGTEIASSGSGVFTFTAAEDFFYNFGVSSKISGNTGGFVLKWEFENPLSNNSPLVASSLSYPSGSITNFSPKNTPIKYREDPNVYLSSQSTEQSIWYKYVTQNLGESLVFVYTASSNNFNDIFLWRKEDGVYKCINSRVGIESVKTASTPALNDDEEAYVQYKGLREPSATLSWSTTTPLKKDLPCSSSSEFDSTSGVTFSGGTMKATQGQYAQIDVPNDWHRTNIHSILISFDVKYNDTNYVNVGTYGAEILNMYNTSSTEIASIHLSGLGDGGTFAYSDVEGGVGAGTGNNSVAQTNIKPTNTRWVHIDVAFSWGGATLFVNGVYAGQFLDGVIGALGFLRFGYPGTIGSGSNPSSTIEIDNIKITETTCNNPHYSSTKTQAWGATGWEAGDRNFTQQHTVGGAGGYVSNQGYTTFRISSNGSALVTGTSRGNAIRLNKVLVGQSQVDGNIINFVQQNEPQLVAPTGYSFWLYPEAYPSNDGRGIELLTFSLNSEINGGFNLNGFGQINITKGGVPYIPINNHAIVGDQLLTTGRWHHLEVHIVDWGAGRPFMRWWINGVQQTDAELLDHYNWTMTNHVYTMFQWRSDQSGDYTSSALFTDMVCVNPTGTAFGPIKTQMLSPTSDGTHSLGPDSHGDFGPTIPNFIKASNDGTTWSRFDPGAGDTAYDKLTFPSSNDFIGQSNGQGAAAEYYIELDDFDSLTDTTSEIVSISPIIIKRQWKMLDFGILGHTDNPDPSQTGSRSAGSSQAIYTLGSESFRTYPYFIENGAGWHIQRECYPLSPDGNAWTSTEVNSLSVKWGIHFFGEQGPACRGIGLEVAQKDSYPSTSTAYTTLHPPTLFTPSLNSSSFEDLSQDSCDGDAESDGLDPLMGKNVVVWELVFDHPKIDPTFYTKRIDDALIFWRVLPAFDNSIPGFDGSFHDTATDETNKTRSADYLGRVTKYGNQAGGNRLQGVYPQRWVNTEYPIGDMTAKSYNFFNRFDGTYADYIAEPMDLHYNPCADFSKWDMNRQVVIEAYCKDSKGRLSSTVTRTLTIPRGTCCPIGPINLSRIRFRAHQMGDTEV